MASLTARPPPCCACLRRTWAKKPFRAGVNAYLKQHEYANATAIRFLGCPGENLEQAGGQDHAHMGATGGRSHHQCEGAVLGEFHQRATQPEALLLRPGKIRGGQ